MPSITIRDVPEDVRNELAARAARSGRSLQEYLTAELAELARRPDVIELVSRARQRARAAERRLRPDEILTHRDAERR